MLCVGPVCPYHWLDESVQLKWTFFLSSYIYFSVFHILSQRPSLKSLIVWFHHSFGTINLLQFINYSYRDKSCSALLNFEIYYWADNSKSLLYWLQDSPASDTPAWLQIESSSCTRISLSALLCSSVPLHTPQDCQNPITLHSLKIWSQFRQHYGLVSMSTYAPITANHLFLASLIDSAFDQWFQTGLLNIRRCIKKIFLCHLTKLKMNLPHQGIISSAICKLGTLYKVSLLGFLLCCQRLP